jgi:hypothetical protein
MFYVVRPGNIHKHPLIHLCNVSGISISPTGAERPTYPEGGSRTHKSGGWHGYPTRKPYVESSLVINAKLRMLFI